MTFRAHVLGSAAGGGLPQWNCGCENCNLARAGTIPAQTQSSLALSANGTEWAVLNASPDIRDQMLKAPPLHPSDLRKSPLRSVLLTNGDIDHIAGLLTLREQQAFTLFATPEIHRVLAENPIFNALHPDFVKRVSIELGCEGESRRANPAHSATEHLRAGGGKNVWGGNHRTVLSPFRFSCPGSGFSP